MKTIKCLRNIFQYTRPTTNSDNGILLLVWIIGQKIGNDLNIDYVENSVAYFSK